MDSLGSIWIHLDSLGFTWIHLDSLELTRSHQDSLEPQNSLDHGVAPVMQYAKDLSSFVFLASSDTWNLEPATTDKAS